MVCCGYNNFYMANRYFMGGCAPFNLCRGNGFGTGVKLGILSYLSGVSSPFNMNMNFGFGFGFGMNNGFSMPSFSYNSTPSVFGYGNSSQYSSYTPTANTTTFGDILRMYNYGPSANYNNSFYSNNTIQNQTFDFGINDNEEVSKSSGKKSVKTNYTTQSASTDFKLDKQFIDRVKEIAKNLNCDYKDLLAVMNSESGINPHKWNGKTAVGLIQFTNYSLADIKRVYGESYTKEQVGNMSGMEQLDLVEKYLTLAKSYSFSKDAKLSAGDLYAVVFAPSIASNEVLYRKGSDAYAQNPLDLDGDGVISKTDLANHLQKKQVNLTA